MHGKLFKISIILSLLFSAQAFGQTRACKISALAALKPIPKLRYQCDDDSADSANRVLFEKNRRRAVNVYAQTLEKLASQTWWQTDVEDLSVCDFRKKAGALSEEEQAKYRDEYFSGLFGNRRFRAIVVRDPCYGQDFSVLNVFLLNRVGNKVFAAPIIDSFTSRADFPIAFKTGLNGAEPIIEIATTSGGLNPTETNYYFTIDKKTNRAVPKKMFKDENGKRTNQVTSMMLMGDAQHYGLPRGVESLQVIKNGSLAKTFDVFLYTGEPLGDGDYQKFNRRTLRWNGRFYE